MASMARSSLSFNAPSDSRTPTPVHGVEHDLGSDDCQSLSALRHVLVGEPDIDQRRIRLASQDGRKDIFGQLVLHQRCAGFRQVVRLDGGHLGGHSTGNRFVTGPCQGDVYRWTGRDVRLREVDDLVPLVGDAHSRHDGVVLALHQVGYDAVPFVGHPDAFQIGPPAQLVAQLPLEPVDLALVVDEVVRGIGSLRAHPDDFGSSEARQAEGHEHGNRKDQSDHFHVHLHRVVKPDAIQRPPVQIGDASWGRAEDRVSCSPIAPGTAVA